MIKLKIAGHLTGIEPRKFMELLNLLEPLRDESRNKRLNQKNRIREFGGGRKSSLLVKQKLFYRFGKDFSNTGMEN